MMLSFRLQFGLNFTCIDLCTDRTVTQVPGYICDKFNGGNHPTKVTLLKKVITWATSCSL
ncbi:hypothetical protein Plhal304r1_c017g0061751 [Plasmopara halstedii]